MFTTRSSGKIRKDSAYVLALALPAIGTQFANTFVQIVDTRMGEMTDLKTQMLDLISQISQVPEAEIVKKSQIEVAGQAAPFFIATYQAKNKMKQVGEFGHTQLALLHDPYFI